MDTSISVRPVYKTDSRLGLKINMDLTKPISHWKNQVSNLYLHAKSLTVPFVVVIGDDTISGSRWLNMIDRIAKAE